ncbi:regulator of Vps4 activity in the MVB pathway-domain-containing protein [Vararia minispora EC-137]|uniref:Regulator of Vps4 activity in the MVB pathway-domain-containing protein n=1 Tax=Vararia minispora EC-137 TaxID=1314806 RepID=A0ACB8QKW9_9AGAM|nr:regulator of Vps4 activity in the MVB pathway-domain-containing protein [Vararia minispora EC-137]
MASWDPTRAKSQLRLAAQRLAQQRDRTDAQGHVVSRDIATLLGQRQTMLARAKAQRLIRDEILGDMLEHLEMHLGVLSERIAELDSRTPSPPVLEAAATVIYAAPYLNFKDLDVVRDMLGVCFGPEFLQTAATNRDQLASSKVIRALSAPPPSAADLDAYLVGIAQTYKIGWEPELRTDDVLRVLSEILDKGNTAPTVDIPRLRRVCAHGVPSAPPFLRPRTWKILLGTLPVLKSSWDKEAMKSRANYYELVRRLLAPFADLPSPTDPLAPLDAALVTATKDLFRVPHGLFAGLEQPPEPWPDCPLDASAPVEVRIPFADVLDARLDAIHALRSVSSSADGAGAGGMPSISITTPDGAAEPDAEPTSRAFSTGGAHARHGAALVRLLYIHSALNPAHRAPHLASLLIPLYSVLQREVEPAELAHAEADAFWLFEALVGEFSELEDEEGGSRWMQRFGERVGWADPELAQDLHTKGLSPNLPHYSYRWLAPMLTHTLPLSAVLSVWDALFSRPPTTRESSPKLDYLLDICTAMLLRARGPISRLGKSGRRSPGLWGEENGYREPPSPVRAWELNDAFIEGMALLQIYPVEAAGGVESILQTAADLAYRREQEARALRAAAAPGTLGARLRDTVWRGFTNQVASPARTPETSDEEDEGEDEQNSTQDEGGQTEREPARPAAAGTAAGFATSLWKGLGRSRPAGVSPSSSVASSPSSTTSSLPAPRTPAEQAGPSALWSYAEKIRDSDTAAAFAKASTNWRVKALQAWSARGAPPPPPPSSSPTKGRSGSFSVVGSEKRVADDTPRRSLPPRDPREAYSPPARPAFFKQPRDSWMPQPRRSPLSSPTTPDVIIEEEAPSRGRAAAIRESLASLTAFGAAPKPTPSPGPEKRAGPRPLLLNSANLMTGPSPTPSRAPQDRFSVHAHSMASPGARGSDAESDATESRIVKLNRSSMSPMALAARHARMASRSPQSAGSAVPPRQASPPNAPVADPDSPTTLPSSPPPHTPPPRSKLLPGDTSDSMAEQPAKPRLIRTKRTAAHLAHLNIAKDGVLAQGVALSPSPIASSPGSTLAPPPQWEEHETATTPRAAVFPRMEDERSSTPISPRSRVRKTSSGDGQARARKTARKLSGTRARKTSDAWTRESGAEEGDDEGYDDLLSAYESEGSASHH